MENVGRYTIHGCYGKPVKDCPFRCEVNAYSGAVHPLVHQHPITGKKVQLKSLHVCACARVSMEVEVSNQHTS